MNNKIIEAFILAVGLALIGFMINAGISNFKDRDRVVSVKGLAEMEVAADKVVWPLMYKELGNDLLTLYNNIQTKNNTIVAFLKANGVTEEELSVAAPEIIDMEAERYSAQAPQYRYNATSVITVTSKDVEKIRGLISGQTRSEERRVGKECRWRGWT